MTEYRTIVLSVTAKVEIPEDESHLDHQRSLCNVIKGIPDVTCVEVESSKISGKKRGDVLKVSREEFRQDPKLVVQHAVDHGRAEVFNPDDTPAFSLSVPRDWDE